MAKRRFRRWKSRAKSFTLPIAPIAGIVAMPDLSYMVNEVVAGDFSKVPQHMGALIGMWEGRWLPDLFIKNMAPPFVGFAVHYIASKLGVNRMLGQAGIPIIRI